MTRNLRTNNRHADNARRLLRHYFSLVARQSGISWDGDMNAEVGDIVDELLLAMWDEIENEAEYHETETAGDEDVTVTQAKAQLESAQLALLDKLNSLGVQVGDVRKELLGVVAATFDLARVGTSAEVDDSAAQYMDHLRSVRG